MVEVAAPGWHGAFHEVFIGAYTELFHPFRLSLSFADVFDRSAAESLLGLEYVGFWVFEVVL